MAPDGESVAYALSSTDASNSRDRSEIRVLEVASGRERRASVEQVSASYPRWSADGRRLAYVSTAERGSTITIVDVLNGERRALEIPRAAIQGPPAWAPDGSRIAVVLATRDETQTRGRRIASREFRADGIGFVAGIRQRLCLLDVMDGSVVTLVDELGFYSQLDWDGTGDQLLFLGTRDPIPGASYSPALYSVRIRDGAVRMLLSDGWYIASARWIPGGGRVALIGAHRSRITIPATDLWVLDCATNEVSCRSTDVKARVGFRLHHDMPIWETSQLNGLVMRGPDSAWVTVQDGGRVEVWDIALSGPARCSRVISGDRGCIPLSTPAARDKLLFLATDMLRPPDLYLFDGLAEKQITHVNEDALKHWPALYSQSLRFRSADGLELEGWFLSSAQHSATGAEGPGQASSRPTVMFIHGGPFIATGHAFRFDLHLLASHGLGVLFANFRGSFGYGEDFAGAIMGGWGERGFPDHMAAIDRAIELGLADASRLGVWGASHGGYATAWIVGHTDRFRAAIAEAAVTDLASAYYLSDAPDIFARDLGGKPHEIPELYRRHSPLTYATRATTPTLLIHGEQDLRCPMSEAEQFHRALLDADCISEIARLPDASHMGDSIGPPHTRVAQNEALLDWFTKYLL